MRDFSLAQLQALVDVVELGGFSAAAERLGLTQPAVSLQVRQLERRLGVVLVERFGRRTRPTAAGAELVAHARRIREAVDQAVAAVSPYASGVTGRVRLGTGSTACTYLLPTALRRLRRRFPELDIVVRTGNAPEILRALEANDLDLALVTLPAPGRMFEVTPLFEDEFVLIASVDATPPSELTPERLAAEPLVLYEPGGHTRRVIDEWFAARGARPQPVMELGSIEAIKELVGAGLGFGIVPRMAMGLRGGDPSIVAMPLAPRLSRTLALALRRDKVLSSGLREAIAAVREAASG